MKIEDSIEPRVTPNHLQNNNLASCAVGIMDSRTVGDRRVCQLANGCILTPSSCSSSPGSSTALAFDLPSLQERIKGLEGRTQALMALYRRTLPQTMPDRRIEPNFMKTSGEKKKEFELSPKNGIPVDGAVFTNDTFCEEISSVLNFNLNPVVRLASDQVPMEMIDAFYVQEAWSSESSSSNDDSSTSSSSDETKSLSSTSSSDLECDGDSQPLASTNQQSCLPQRKLTRRINNKEAFLYCYVCRLNQVRKGWRCTSCKTQLQRWRHFACHNPEKLPDCSHTMADELGCKGCQRRRYEYYWVECYSESNFGLPLLGNPNRLPSVDVNLPVYARQPSPNRDDKQVVERTEISVMPPQTSADIRIAFTNNLPIKMKRQFSDDSSGGKPEKKRKFSYCHVCERDRLDVSKWRCSACKLQLMRWRRQARDDPAMLPICLHPTPNVSSCLGCKRRRHERLWNKFVPHCDFGVPSLENVSALLQPLVKGLISVETQAKVTISEVDTVSSDKEVSELKRDLDESPVEEWELGSDSGDSLPGHSWMREGQCFESVKEAPISPSKTKSIRSSVIDKKMKGFPQCQPALSRRKRAKMSICGVCLRNVPHHRMYKKWRCRCCWQQLERWRKSAQHNPLKLPYCHHSKPDKAKCSGCRLRRHEILWRKQFPRVDFLKNAIVGDSATDQSTFRKLKKVRKKKVQANCIVCKNRAVMGTGWRCSMCTQLLHRWRYYALADPIKLPVCSHQTSVNTCHGCIRRKYENIWIQLYSDVPFGVPSLLNGPSISPQTISLENAKSDGSAEESESSAKVEELIEASDKPAEEIDQSEELVLPCPICLKNRSRSALCGKWRCRTCSKQHKFWREQDPSKLPSCQHQERTMDGCKGCLLLRHKRLWHKRYPHSDFGVSVVELPNSSIPSPRISSKRENHDHSTAKPASAIVEGRRVSNKPAKKTVQLRSNREELLKAFCSVCQKLRPLSGWDGSWRCQVCCKQHALWRRFAQHDPSKLPSCRHREPNMSRCKGCLIRRHKNLWYKHYPLDDFGVPILAEEIAGVTVVTTESTEVPVVAV